MEFPYDELGCDAIGERLDFWGGLDPTYPIAPCPVNNPAAPASVERIQVDRYEYSDKGNYFFISGGGRSQAVRYVIYRDGEYVLIETEDEFREIFAPIESAEEALSYVLAVTGLEAKFDLAINPNLDYFVNVVPETRVDIIDDDRFMVLLFQESVFGCGPHPTYGIYFVVNQAGFVEQVNCRTLFKDPKQDDLCVD